MNTVVHTGWLNNSNKTRDAILCVNGNYIIANPLEVGRKAPLYEKAIVVWYCQASNEWNRSATETFEAKTLKALIGTLEKHPYSLVK